MPLLMANEVTDNTSLNMDTTTSQKRVRLPDDSPQNSGKKKSKKKGGCICPICMEIIVESTKSKAGHDAIYCEGLCNSWLHRRCAGLSKPLFTSMEKSSDPFYCPHCQLKNYLAEITNLKSTIASLTQTVSTLQSSFKLPDQPSTSEQPTNDVPSKVPVAGTHHIERSQSILEKNSALSSPNFTDKKFNIIMYGIKESPPKTSKVNRLDHDLQCIANAFAKVELPIETNSIRDCFRLGKFKHDAQRPRPILIKFLRSTEVTMALSKIADFQAPVVIKPDLTPEERKIESFLLKERWSLTQLGFEKTRIKIRNKSILVDNKLYGQFKDSQFCRSQFNPPLNLNRQTGATPQSVSQPSSSQPPSSEQTT